MLIASCGECLFGEQTSILEEASPLMICKRCAPAPRPDVRLVYWSTMAVGQWCGEFKPRKRGEWKFPAEEDPPWYPDGLPIARTAQEPGISPDEAGRRSRAFAREVWPVGLPAPYWAHEGHCPRSNPADINRPRCLCNEPDGLQGAPKESAEEEAVIDAIAAYAAESASATPTIVLAGRHKSSCPLADVAKWTDEPPPSCSCGVTVADPPASETVAEAHKRECEFCATTPEHLLCGPLYDKPTVREYLRLHGHALPGGSAFHEDWCSMGLDNRTIATVCTCDGPAEQALEVETVWTDVDPKDPKTWPERWVLYWVMLAGETEPEREPVRRQEFEWPAEEVVRWAPAAPPKHNR